MITNNAPAVFVVGTTTVTWTATDAAGNTATATQTVTIVSVSIPAITAPATVTVYTDPNAAYATNVTLGSPSLSITNVPDLTITNDAPAVFAVGTTSVTWTVSDNFGNSSSSVQLVIVIDNESPVLNAPADLTVNTSTGKAYAENVSLGNASATDNVPGVTITNDNVLTEFPIGITTILWTATDAAGNTTTQNQTIIVLDNQAPTVTAPANVVVSTDTDESYASGVSLGNPIVSDNSNGLVTVTNNAPAQFPLGSTIVTWKAVDEAGNIAIAIQTVTVADNQAPSITAPGSVNVSIGLNQSYATGVALGSATATDNVPGIITISNNALVNYPLGTTVITWTAKDAAGNIATATQTVTVSVMSQPPLANCKPATVTLVNGVATISVSNINNGSTAAAGIASMSLSKTTFNCSNIGNNIVTLTVTDKNGLSSTCTTTVTVIGAAAGAVSITSVPANNTYTGGVSTNLYLGYGAQSTTLKVNAPASGAPYTYSWTGTELNSTTAATPVFTPTAAGSYTFTVKLINKYGCSSTASINICVRDIRDASSNGKKVFICHIPPGNPSNANVLSVSINAVAAHLAHGDQLGSCNQVCGTVAKGIVEPIPPVAAGLAFEVQVAPNPTSNFFALRVKSSDNETAVTVRVVDVFGRTIEKQTITAGGTLKFGERYANGAYYAEVIQGSEKKVIKLMKL
jgi:hypothetical protein